MTRSSLLLLLYVFALLSLVFHSRDGDAKIMCIEKERQALLQIKQGLNDDEGVLSDWGNENRDCCNWYGVSCSSESSHHVTGLYLYLTDVSSKLNPYHLANLSSLQTLDLRGNFININGRLEWLNHLPSIQCLSLDGFNLSEANDWLQVVHKLPYLTNFYLENCSLPDPMPPSLSFIYSSSALETLHLSNNHLTSSIFQWLFNFTGSLVSLDLSFNQLGGGLPNPKIFSSLEHLDLGYNRLNGTIPESMGNLSKLEYLNVAGNSFEGEISDAHFSKLSELYHLELSSNSLILNFSSDWDPPLS